MKNVTVCAITVACCVTNMPGGFSGGRTSRIDNYGVVPCKETGSEEGGPSTSLSV